MGCGPCSPAAGWSVAAADRKRWQRRDPREKNNNHINSEALVEGIINKAKRFASGDLINQTNKIKSLPLEVRYKRNSTSYQRCRSWMLLPLFSALCTRCLNVNVLVFVKAVTHILTFTILSSVNLHLIKAALLYHCLHFWRQWWSQNSGRKPCQWVDSQISLDSFHLIYIT